MCKGRDKRILSDDGGKIEMILRQHGTTHPIQSKKNFGIPIPYYRRQSISVGRRDVELYVVVRRPVDSLLDQGCSHNEDFDLPTKTCAYSPTLRYEVSR